MRYTHFPSGGRTLCRLATTASICALVITSGGNSRTYHDRNESGSTCVHGRLHCWVDDVGKVLHAVE